MVERALAHAEEHDVDLASLEGFVRQVIGWREYMRASYVVHGRACGPATCWPDPPLDRAGGRHHRAGPGRHGVGRVSRHGYAHHIERLMVLGNAMLLLRTDPDEVYEWFMRCSSTPTTG